MKIALSLVITLFVATVSAAEAQAPPRPRPCRYVVDIQDGKIATTTQPKANCQFKGKFLVSVNNLDNVKYRVAIRDFKFNSGSPTTCSGGAPVAPPLTGISNQEVSINVKSERTHTKKVDVRTMGANTAECYKFDVVLFESGTEKHRLDPELEIAQPLGPPPGGGQE
jgi:hypothetical protein